MIEFAEAIRGYLEQHGRGEIATESKGLDISSKERNYG